MAWLKLKSMTLQECQLRAHFGGIVLNNFSNLQDSKVKFIYYKYKN